MSDASSPRPVPVRLIIILFAAIFGALALGYVLFLRPAYVPVFSNLRPAEASAVAAQLDAKSIAYRLGDNGATLLVPSDQADQARLLIAGSDVPLKGGVGFELFNKSDMGLTDFAQRINYQRALQGELERTIMLIDEVETARVHLALPERSLFRSERSPSKAAVELIAKPGRQLDGDKVAGIQRLVAFAVPDLLAADVVIVDEDGRVLSQSGTPDTLLTPEAEAQQAVARYYRARARAAVEPMLPGVQVDIRVVVLDKEEAGMSMAPAAAETPAPATAVTPAPASVATPGPVATAAVTAATKPPTAAPPAHRDFRLRFVVATASPLDAEQTRLARDALAAAVRLDEAAGDEVSFEVGLGPSAEASPVRAAAAPVSGIPPIAAGGHRISASEFWIDAALAFVGIIAIALLFLRRALTPRLSPGERDAMIERIRAALHTPEAVDAG